MAKVKLLVEVGCDAEICGACEWVEGRDERLGRCRLFVAMMDAPNTPSKPFVFKRLPACLDAEARAKKGRAT